MCDQSNQEQNVSNDSGVNDVLKIFDAYFETPNNLFALLYRYKVRVPGIQRHYVQGADTAKAKEVRENFIKQLLSDEPTHLHFVYGPIDTTGEDAFTPVDGQQRLTTLWLLARYAIECLPEEQKTYRDKYLSLLSRFSYADRIHATRFCQALTDPENHWDIDKDPFESVPHQSWFWDYWNEDETVSSMLRMLSTIHKQSPEMKKNSSSDSMNLLKHIATGITFSLQIDSYADDIYMKMNARGLQLTQWENFKGKFAELLLSEASRKDWEEKVEKLSDKYFAITKELPDTAFFSLFCRLLYFKLLTTSQSEKKTDGVQSLSKIAQYTNQVNDKEKWGIDNLPYVPFDEIRTAFKNLNKYLKEDEFTRQYLEMLEFLLKTNGVLETNGVFPFDSPYWQSERKLWHSVFMPKNQNELDLSYFIWCYLNENRRPNKQINGNDFSKALRCMWNVLENVSRDDNFEGRLKKFEVFIKGRGASLYGSNTETNEQFTAGQWKEEIKKASIYAGGCAATSDLVNLLHDAECCLHGRIRIGLYNLNNANEIYELDVIDKNLKWINNLFKQWNSAEEKSEIRKNIILNIMFSESPAPEASMLLSTKDDNLRKLLTTSDDEFLQSTLFTGNRDFAKKIDLCNITPSISYRKKGSFDRDWRVSLVRLANENVDIWEHAIKKYCYDGGIYAFKGANIKNAIPINDWRIEFWFKVELRNAFLKLPWKDGCNPNWAQNDSKEGMRMNDSNTYSNWIIYQKGKDRLIYFWSHKITLSTDSPGKHEEIFPVSKAENADVPAFISELIRNIKILMS